MISLRSTPFPIDFAGNNPRFEIKAKPYAVSAVRGSVTYAIYQIPYVSGIAGTLVLTTPYGTVTRQIIPSTTASSNPQHIKASSAPATIADRLLDRLCNEAAVTEHYTTEVWTGTGFNNTPCCFLKLSQRSPKAETLPTLSYQQDGQEILSVSGLPVFHLWENTSGRAGISREGYLLRGRFLVNRQIDRRGAYLDVSTDSENIETPEFAIWCNGDNATIDTRLLKSYFNKMDLPAYGEQLGTYPLRHNTIRYRLRCGDHYDSDTDTEYTRTFGERVLVNGMIEWSRFRVNAPDWTAHSDALQLSSLTTLINWGTPYKAMRRIFDGCELFVYVANFTPANRTATVQIDCGQTSFTDALSISTNTIVRIPVGTSALPSDLNPSSVGSYTVNIRDCGVNLTTLRIELIPKPYHARVLLLQNHLGVAETFITEQIVFERETAGNDIVLNGDRDMEMTEVGTLLTLRTGYRTKEEMRLLADAYTRHDNYILWGSLAYRINFVPGTLTVIDEGEDLQSAEVQVTIGKPIERILHKLVYIYSMTILLDKIEMNDHLVLCDMNSKTDSFSENSRITDNLFLKNTKKAIYSLPFNPKPTQYE